MCFLWPKVLLYHISTSPLQAFCPGLVSHVLQCRGFCLSVQQHTMARKWGFHDGFMAHLLLPSFPLACTRSILISVHQARDKVRCDRYDKCVCNNRENSNAFKNSIPNSYSKRSVELIPDTTAEVITIKTTGVIHFQ